MTDMKWTRCHENVTQIKSIDDMCRIKKENHIIVLPEGVRMRDAISLYSTKKNYMSNIFTGIIMVFLMVSLIIIRICTC